MTPRRWFSRALLLCFCGLIGILLLTAGATWWAHRHLTRLVVAAVNRSFPELRLTARTVALTASDTLELKAIRLQVVRDGSEALHIPSARVRFSWRELRQQFIREIVIDQPSVRVNEALMSVFSRNGGTAGASPGLSWRLGKLAVNGGVARVDLNGWPSARFGFALEFSENGMADNRCTINDLHVRVRGAAEDALIIPSLKISASEDGLRQGRIRDVQVVSPQIRLTDDQLAMLPKSSNQPLAQPAWSVDRLAVTDGKAQVQLAAWPELAFDFSAQAQDVMGNGGMELALSSIRARVSGEATETLAIERLQVALTAVGLRNRTVQQIEFDAPHLSVTDRVLAWRPPPMTSASAANEPSWNVQRLVVRRGRVRLDLADAPLAECGFNLRLQEATLAPEGLGELQSAEVLNLALRARRPGVEPFLRVPAVRAEFRLGELLRQRRLARVRLEHLEFRYNEAFREMIASGAKPSLPQKPATGEKAPPYTIGELRLSDGRIHLDDLGLGIPGIECRLETTFRELALAPDAGEGGHELQTIELSQIALRSPLDPFFTVLELDSIFLRFTLAGLWKREIEEVAIVRPTLAIGPDLFWYVDRVQQSQETVPVVAPASAAEGPAWSIRQFSATSGQLVLALEGQAKLALPMPFESHAENLDFRRLSDLRLKLNIDMPEQDYDYPGYEMTLRGVSGRIEFSLPPKEGANNVVNTLRFRDVRWKNFRGRDVFLDVTYDERGVYGNLSGKGYAGIVRGQFNFLLTPASDWNGWVSGTQIDLGGITKVLAPEKFSLTGPADFRLTVAAQARQIQNVKGDFKARAPGEMRIGKLDKLIQQLPGDWSSVKQALSRISLETLRDFAYDTAHGDFHFTGLTGALHLDLRGASGSRQIDMNFHEHAAPASARRVASSQR